MGHHDRLKPKLARAYREELRRTQGDRCAICSATDPGGPHGTWKVDHCHATGRVRGLLCNSCNTALGLFGDDVGRLRNAIAYLTRTPVAPQTLPPYVYAYGSRFRAMRRVGHRLISLGVFATVEEAVAARVISMSSE